MVVLTYFKNYICDHFESCFLTLYKDSTVLHGNPNSMGYVCELLQKNAGIFAPTSGEIKMKRLTLIPISATLYELHYYKTKCIFKKSIRQCEFEK